MTDIRKIKELLRRLLASTSEPELGARLKQRLQTELEREGAPPFDERLLGYRKFSEFLAAFSDDFEIIRAGGPGDLRVRLRTGHRPADSRIPQPPRAPVTPVRELPRVQNDVWQAFTNPDPKRKRYLHRVYGKVNHFLDDDQESRFRKEVEEAPQQYLEVSPVPPEEQLAWMREYVEALAPADSQAVALLRLAEGPYSSQLNTMFTAALGESGIGWRRRRAARVYEHIEAWANKHQVPLRLLLERDSTGPAEAHEVRAELDAPSMATPGAGTARERALQLVAMLSDQDVEELVLPLLLTTLWTTTRRSP